MPEANEPALFPAALNAILDRLVTPVWVFDVDRSQLVWANAAGCRLWKAESPQELYGRDFATGMSVTVAERLRQYQVEFDRSDAVFSEIWTHYPKGVPSTIRVTYSGIKLADGRTAMLAEGGPEFKETPDKLRSAEAVMHTPMMITLSDEKGAVLYCNPAAEAMRAAQAGTIDAHFVHPADLSLLRAQLDDHGQAQIIAEVRTARGTRWHEITARRCMDPVTGSPACLASEVDVTLIKHAEARARHDACHDPLTGMANRAAVRTLFEQRLQDRLARSCSAALLFVDLDRFKGINDSLGHTRGDQLLVEIAERLSHSISGRGEAARLGGDEFLILLELASDREGVAEEIEDFVSATLAALRAPIVLGEHDLRLTASIGISVAPLDGTDVAALMKNADAAMYASKKGGGNRGTRYTVEMGLDALTRMRMEIDLRGDFEDGKLQLYFQPRVCVKTGRIVSAEVLLRWPQETGGVSPEIFIPLAEDSGLIVPIGVWVLREAARQQVAWQRAGYPLKLSVNVSPRQFTDCDFVQAAREALEDAGARAADIELEITERLLLSDEPRVADTLQGLRNMGFGISIDDFGVGYSNLAELHRHPIDCLKIDRSFVNNLAEHGPIMNLIIEMCRLMQVRIVAEGVETPSQLAWLAERDCDEYQGYHFSRPLSAAAFEPLLEADIAAAAVASRMVA